MIRQASKNTFVCQERCLGQFASPLTGETGRYVWIEPEIGKVEISNMNHPESILSSERPESPWSRALHGAALLGVMFLGYFFLFWFLQSCVLGVSQFDMIQSATHVHSAPR